MAIKIKKTALIIIFCLLGLNVHAQERKFGVTLEDFIRLVCKKDKNFQKILIDELKLKYKKAINIPAKDFVVSVESKYNFLFKPDEEDTQNSVSLSRLFPYTGTDFSAEYSSSLALSTRNVTSDVTLQITQPIARNAFGRNTRLLDMIIGIEIEVAKYQIAEAYEDYLAALIQIYYDWYSAHENLRTARNSYNENLKLLKNIKEREKSRIALPIDVNKISLQVLAKKENLIVRQNEYADSLSRIEEALRYDGAVPLEPRPSSLYANLNIDFVAEYETSMTSSRTAGILNLLEDKSSLDVDRYADELLPSIDLLMGYTLKGSDQNLKDKEKTVYAGVSLEWPLPGVVERADYETSKIEQRKTQLSAKTTRVRLYTVLKILSSQIEKEKGLIAVAEEKVRLAEAIVEDEKENYSLGRSTLNDLIDEINKLEDNKISRITHEIQLRKLIIDWLRLTDKLVAEGDILSRY